MFYNIVKVCNIDTQSLQSHVQSKFWGNSKKVGKVHFLFGPAETALCDLFMFRKFLLLRQLKSMWNISQIVCHPCAGSILVFSVLFQF